jgi:hypothetical protein
MSKPGLINLETTNTFQNWLDSTNELIVLLKTDVLTASALGDSTTGNATLIGTFSANTLVASETLRANSVEAIGSLSNPIVFRSPITANTSGPATFTHSSVAGPRSLFTNSTVTWQIGFESAANTDFVITTGSGESRFKVESNGTVTANAFKAVTLEGNLLGSANNSINLGGQPSSFYTNANNIISGTLSTDRLSGTYNITSSNSNNLSGQPSSFYTNASNISSGILPVARLSGTYTINISGFSADSSAFGGQAPSFYTNIPARLGYTPVNRAGDTFTGPVTFNTQNINIGAGRIGEISQTFQNSGRIVYHFLSQNGDLFGAYDATGGFSRWFSNAAGNFFVPNGGFYGSTSPAITSQFGIINAHQIRDYATGGTNIRTWGDGADLRFRWDGSALRYRVNEATDTAIAPLPTSAGTIGQWVAWNSNILPVGGTWAYSLVPVVRDEIFGDEGGGSSIVFSNVLTRSGVAAGGTNTGAIGTYDIISGTVWRIA